MASWKEFTVSEYSDRRSSFGARVGCLALLLICSASRVLSIDELSTGGHLEEFGPLKTVCGWQLPNGPVTKVLAIFPGGNIGPYSYWDRSPACPSCSGLPETRKFVIDAIARNYAVFILQSFTWCFDSLPLENPEMQNFQAIFSDWKRSKGLENVSTVAVGMSCGGYFLFSLGLVPGLFDSIAMMLAAGEDEAMAVVTPEYPPTLFMHMPKDDLLKEKINRRRRELDNIGVPTDVVWWFEHPVTRDWFAQLIPGVDLALSTAVKEALRADGWLEDGSDLLKSDVYNADFDTVVRRWNVLPQDPWVSDQLSFQASIRDELNVAFAFHSTFSRLNDQMFAWFEGGYDDKRRVAIV